MKKLLAGTSMLWGLTCAVAGCTDEGEGSFTTSSGAVGGTSVSSSGAGAGGTGGTGGMGGAGGMGGGGGAPDPSDLKVSIAGGSVELSWVKSNKPTSRIVRAENTLPLGPDDPIATVVYEGAASLANEALRGLFPTTPDSPRTYYYAVYGCDAGGCGGEPAMAELSPTVGQALVGGGYNIVWRHAAADVCTDAVQLGTAVETQSPNWWKSCDANCGTATARQLNAQGVNQSTQIGAALVSRGVLFDRVLASEFCRCVKTAELMDLGPTIEQRPDITYFVHDEANRCANTMKLVALEPAAGKNVGIVGHAGFTCATLDTLAWGEAAVYKPDGNGGSIYITRVASNEWAALP